MNEQTTIRFWVRIDGNLERGVMMNIHDAAQTDIDINKTTIKRGHIVQRFDVPTDRAEAVFQTCIRMWSDGVIRWFNTSSGKIG